MAKKLLEIVSDTIRVKHYSYKTEQTYIGWIMNGLYSLMLKLMYPKGISSF